MYRESRHCMLRSRYALAWCAGACRMVWGCERLRCKQEELEQWAIAGRQKEEDHVVFKKYAREDDSRIRDLPVAIEKART